MAVSHFFLLALLFSAVLSGSDPQPNHGNDGKHRHSTNTLDNYYRLLVTINNKHTQADLASVLDVNHTAFRALGVHDDAYIAQYDKDTFEYMWTYYGLNFTAGVYNPFLTSWTIPGVATLYPYKLEDTTYRIAYDSENLDRGEDGDWYIHNYGSVAIMAVNGVFPGGLYVGNTFGANDILSYTTYHFLKNGTDWTNPKNRELILTLSSAPCKQLVNSQGLLDQYINAQVVDERGNVGYASVSAHSQRNLTSGVLNLVTTNVIRFPSFGKALAN